MMNLRYPILVLFLGFALTLFGALFKLESWQYATEMLALGIILEVIGVGLLLYRFFQKKDSE